MTLEGTAREGGAERNCRVDSAPTGDLGEEGENYHFKTRGERRLGNFLNIQRIHKSNIARAKFT